MRNRTLLNVIIPENDAEAAAFKSLLEDHGIYAEVRSFHDTAYDGLFQAQYGWGVIRVYPEDADKARRIIDEWKNASPERIPWKNSDQKSP